MSDWLIRALAATREGRCLVLPGETLPGSGRALALAPHPDDPDAVCVTLRALQRGGWEVFWTVLTSGWSGVEDSFAGPGRDDKRRVREAEQRESAGRFGLIEGRLVFLALQEDERGELAPEGGNRDGLFSHLDRLMPDVVALPCENDSNPTHSLTHRWFAEWAGRHDRPVIALANEDPKTIDFRPGLEVVFDEAAAVWKASLLDCHRSQSARNLSIRGITFAERILKVNRKGEHWAERFQVESFSDRPFV